MITVNKCPMCESEILVRLKKMKFFYPGDELEDNLIDIRYVRLWILFEKILKDRKPVEFYSTLCKSCGFIFTNPRFTAGEMAIKYEMINKLGSVKKRLQEYPPSNLDMRAKRIYSRIRSLNEANVKSLRVLDYGGAAGYNLVPFVEAGSSCYIFDYEWWDLPNGVEYLGKELTDLRNGDSFDIILLLHTLEHVIEPMDLLQDLSAHLLSKSGLLFVEVPLGCILEYRNLTEPLTHVNFFSEESLYKGLQRVGLSIVHLSTAYQWVTHGKGWCVNIVGRCGKENVGTKYKTTRRQMKDIGYYWPLAINKVFRTTRNLGRIISGGKR